MPLIEQADKMTIPADENSVLELIFSIINDHLKEPLRAITDLQTLLLKQRGKPLTAQGDSDLQNLQDILLNTSRLAAQWTTRLRLRLLFKPSTFVEKLRNMFKDIRESFYKLQVLSKDNVVEELDKVLLDVSDRVLSIELNRVKTRFKKQFLAFLRENRSKSGTSEDTISVVTWLAKQLGSDVGSITEELKEIKVNGGTFLEELILHVTELEERKGTSDGKEIYPSAGLSCEGEESSDPSCDEPLDIIARDEVHGLGLPQMPRVLQGFVRLTKCTILPGGKFEVYKAGAIGVAISLATANDGKYITQALKLLEALTSSRGGRALDSERGKIYLEVSDHLEFLIKLMKAKRHPEARLLAAEIVVNILENQSVCQTVRTQYDIVSALVAISNENAADQSFHDLNRADRVCLLGLARLTEFSKGVNLKINSAADKSQIIVDALMKLLLEGLKDDGESNLAKDSLVALDTQVLVNMDRSPPTHEVCVLVRKHMSELMVTPGFVSHSSVPGRMAIVSIMSKLRRLYKEDFIEGLVLYLLKTMKKTRDEILKLLDSSEDEKEQVKDRTKLLRLSARLLCFCVTHEKNTAQSVLNQYPEGRKTLEKMLDEEDPGILDESKLEILNILDQIDKGSSQDPTAVGRVAILVKMAKSPSPGCRQQVASRLLKCVKEEQDVTEMKTAGVIGALMGLLKEENENCQQDALLALYALSIKKIAIQTDQLPHQTILGFLGPEYQSDVRDAAVGLLDLMVKENAFDAKMFTETPGALGSLVEYVQDGHDSFKQLLTTTLSLICKNGKCSDQEAVTKEGGHIFLLTSLKDNGLKETAAQGLLSLINNAMTRGDVLQAGFATVALKSIKLQFASTDIALSLASICSTPEGLDQIYSTAHSEQALLILLEHCIELVGKGSAAAVITRLYPRLNQKEDLQRQIEMSEACRHLIKYLELDDKSQLKIFLKALAVLATASMGRRLIHEERGVGSLIRYLRKEEIDEEVRDLVLKILAEMSCGITDGDSNYHKIVNSFMENKIAEVLCPLPQSDVFNQNTESMKNLLILIRNLSFAGPTAVLQLSDQGAVDILLKVLKQQETSKGSTLSIVTEVAVKALEKFMDEPSGKQLFLKGGGIESLVAILRLNSSRSSDVKSVTTAILISVAEDPDTRRTACDLIFSDDILLALNAIMYDGETPMIKYQAAVLMTLLAMFGPSKVYAAIKKNYCLETLCHLSGDEREEVRNMANNALNHLRDKDRGCRKIIDRMLSANSK